MTRTARIRPGKRWPATHGWKLTPARIAGIYLAVALAGVYVSEAVLPSVVPAESTVERLVLGGRLLEVVTAAVLIYVVGAGWRDALTRANDHLAAAREELSVLHRIVRHDLRNDVTVVAGHADTLQEAVDRPDVESHCDAIRDSCEDMIGYTEKTKLVADLDHGSVETTELDVASLVDRVRDRVDPPPDAELSASVPDGTRVDAHEYVEFVVLELVENALEHAGEDGPTVRISAGPSPACSGWTRLRVEDDGPGIPEAERDALHREEEPLHHSSGVGLWVARWVVVQSGGDFEIENTDSGCRVTVTLPGPEATPASQEEAALQRFLA